MNSPTLSPFAILLKKLVRLSGFSQAAVAAEAGFTDKTLRNYETGKSRPTRQQLECLIVALDLADSDADDLRRVYRKKIEKRTLAVEINAAPLAPCSPGRFVDGTTEYYELEQFKFGPLGQQPRVILDRSWPKRYHAEENLLVLRTGKTKLVLPAVELVSATKARPLRINYWAEKETYNIPREYDIDEDLRFPGIKFDSAVTRLKSLKVRQDKVTLGVQRCRYYKFARTNLLYDLRRGVIATMRETMDRSGKLHELKDSTLANILGINTLVLDAEGNLLIAARSSEVAYRAGQLTPSSSGTVDWGRVDANQETGNELNIDREDLLEEPTFLGLCRELHRGGIPDLFFFAQTSLSVKEVNDERWDAQEWIEINRLHYFPFGECAIEAKSTSARRAFEEKFRLLLKQLEGKASLPLLINLTLWRNYMLARA